MSKEPATMSPLRLRWADATDREALYQLRHQVYAAELRQHPENDRRKLSDALDEFNRYIIICREEEILGFVSITPPGRNRYSIDKYVPRSAFPFAFDDGVYEVRLLTVREQNRQGPIAALLMYAALRWIDSQGGRWIIGMGRREVWELYSKLGFQDLGQTIVSGDATFHLMALAVEEARKVALQKQPQLRRLLPRLDWQLDVPFASGEGCEHGGAFFQAIGERFDRLENRFAVINADVLDAWFPPAPGVLQALHEHDEWIARTSPPTHCRGLIEAIALARNLPEPALVCGAGSSALIWLALREWLTPHSRVLILDPMYGEYRYVLETIIGCQVERFLLDPSQNYRVDLQQLSDVSQCGYDLIVIVNPNNPTGQYIPADDLKTFLKAVPCSTKVWIDEAYIDYVGPDSSLERLAPKRENLIVCKTMSKVYALSGLRVGYLSTSPQWACELNRLQPPWSVSLPAQIAAVRALADVPYYRRRYAETHQLREQLQRRLREELSMETLGGSANFLLCRWPASFGDGPTALESCRSQGLYLRDVQRMGTQFGPQDFRIAVKDAETNARMIEILRSVQATQAPAACR